MFIVGMPRSGSTLIEQILSMHPDAVSCFETDIFRNIIGMLSMDETERFNLDTLTKATDEQLKNAGDCYINSMRQHFGESRKYIDKSLPNLWLIGAIRILFPQARIIHCTRAPLDICISIFTNDFKGFLYKYSYNLTELGQYYRLYLQMMEHWRTVVPKDNLYDISYENLVANPEEEIRSLLEFCGLTWHNDCLNFHKSTQAVHTASLEQVRKPIYRSSVNRWEHYKSHLGELIEALEGDA